MSSFTDMVGLAMRLLTHAQEIQRLVPRVNDAFATLNEVHTLINKVLGQQAAQRSLANPAHFDVRWLQTSLNRLMGTSLTTDGVYGERTIAAVREFQRQHDMQVNGWADVVVEAKILELLSH